MNKFFKKKEWRGTLIQVFIFALLLPFLAILLGLVKEAAPEALDKLLQGAMSSIPGYDFMQEVLIGLQITDPATAAMRYTEAVIAFVTDNIYTMIYLGMWLYAFRVIFKEIIKLPGIPLLQVMCGFVMGVLTYPMLDEPMLLIMAGSFLAVLNVVITIIFVPKGMVRKIISVVIDLGLQSLLAALTIGYVVILVLSAQAGFPTIGVALGAMTLVLAFWLGCQFIEYLFT